MPRMQMSMLALGVAALVWGCGGEQAAEEGEQRDLSLAPAESIATLSDTAMAAQPQQQPAPVTPAPQAQPRTQPQSQAAAPRPAAPKPAPAPTTIVAGTVMELAAADTLSSRTHKAGDVVHATASQAITDAAGKVLIPAGAHFEGTIEQIKPAESPGGKGTLILAFSRVTFGGRSYAMAARSDTVGTMTRGRGITTGDATKVGVGAAAGAVVGGLIGKDAKGAVIGGVVGAAAGAGVAAITKDQDVVLPAGARIRLVLAEQMVMTPIN